MHQEVKSMLFADIVGYSKISELVIPEFIETFLERVSKLCSTSKHRPRNVNTWGDAVYAIFDFAHDAGCFALELTQLILEGKGGPGFVKSTARIQLVDKGEQTELHCDADAQVGGLIAAIGSRLIGAAAKKMMDDFFKRFAEQVEAGV